MDILTMFGQMPEQPTPPPLPDLPENPREAFCAAHRFLRTEMSNDRAEALWDAHRDRRNRELWAEKFPRRKYTQKVAESTFDLSEDMQAFVEAWVARRTETTSLLDRLANQVDIRPSDEWVEVFISYCSTYATVGLGVSTYTRERARDFADTLQANGFDAKVEHRHTEKRRLLGFAVLAKIHPEDVPILKRKDLKVDLVEWVRGCWARGVNPRVYKPFLPHGFEEKHGISFANPTRDPEGSR